MSQKHRPDPASSPPGTLVSPSPAAPPSIPVGREGLRSGSGGGVIRVYI